MENILFLTSLVQTQERDPLMTFTFPKRHSFIKGLPPINIMACKALFDLVLWHGPQEVDKALGLDHILQSSFDKSSFSFINLSEADVDWTTGSLDLLYARFDNDLTNQ
uniref:Nuclear condensin complex subunit 3 C-terminal domain-containing protein n=1 Tax=Cucumis sativus TaxID=3659 RepID=A0A0A0KTM1_CUCSA